MGYRGLALVTSAALLLGTSVVNMAATDAVPAGRCDRPVVVTSMTWGPGTIVPGGTSTVRLAGRNCTRREKRVTVDWSFEYQRDTAGCPAIAPSVQSSSIPAGKGLRQAVKVTVPQGCKSVTLLATARVNDSAGKLIKVKRANLRIRQKGSGGGGY